MKNIIIRIWFFWEIIFEKLAGIHSVPGGFFRIALRRYYGDKLILRDGTILHPGDKYGELHLNNRLFIGLSKRGSSPAFLGLSSLRESKKSLSSLKEYVKSNPIFTDINVFMGTTLLNRGIGRLGFEVLEMKHGFLKNLTSSYEKLLLAILHPQGLKRLRSKRLAPKLVIITRKTLEGLY